MAVAKIVVVAKTRLQALEETEKALKYASIMVGNPVRMEEPIAKGYCGYPVMITITPDLSEFVVNEETEATTRP